MKYRVQINKERCKGCDLCAEVCPRQVLALSDCLNSAGLHFVEAVAGEACIGCLHCSLICPDAAIEIEENDKE